MAEGHDSEQGLTAGLHHSCREAGQHISQQGKDMQGGGGLLGTYRSRGTSEPVTHHSKPCPRQSPHDSSGADPQNQGEHSPDFQEQESNRMAEEASKHHRCPKDTSYPPQQSSVLQPPLFPPSTYSPREAESPHSAKDPMLQYPTPPAFSISCTQNLAVEGAAG